MSLKCPKTVFGSKRPTGKNLALRTAPASLQNFRPSRSAWHSAFKELSLAALGRHSVFWELFWDVLWALQGGRTCYKGCFFGTLGRHSAFWKLFFGTLGRHSAFWKRFSDSLPSKESFEPYKNPKFQGTKTEVISVLKSARFTGSGAKS